MVETQDIASVQVRDAYGIYALQYVCRCERFNFLL